MTCADADQHPGSNYYVQQVTGTIQQASGLLAKALTGPFGYVGPFDWCSAKQYAAAHTVSGTVNSPGKVAGALAGETGTALGLSGLTLRWPDAHTFLGRTLKIVTGAILLTVGLIKLTGTGKDVAAIARTAGSLA